MTRYDNSDVKLQPDERVKGSSAGIDHEHLSLMRTDPLFGEVLHHQLNRKPRCLELR
jgi:hypothetical protein